MGFAQKLFRSVFTYNLKTMIDRLMQLFHSTRKCSNKMLVTKYRVLICTMKLNMQLCTCILIKTQVFNTILYPKQGHVIEQQEIHFLVNKPRYITGSYAITYNVLRKSVARTMRKDSSVKQGKEWSLPHLFVWILFYFLGSNESEFVERNHHCS